jgi:putative copper export protein
MLDALAAAAKALLYAGLLSCAGVTLAQATLRASQELAQISARIVRRGALLTIVACLAGAMLLMLRLGQLDSATLSAVLSSGSGAAMALQLAGAFLLLATVGDDLSARAMRLANAALVTASFAFSGHAAVVGPAASIVVFVHVATAAWWTGSLWLLRHACSHHELSALATLVRRFSAAAMLVVAALIVAGTTLIVVLVDFARPPLPYVQVLAGKLALVVALLALAGYNKFRLTPRLIAGDSSAVQSLRRAIGVELAVIGAIVAVTAALTTYTTPHT